MLPLKSRRARLAALPGRPLPFLALLISLLAALVPGCGTSGAGSPGGPGAGDGPSSATLAPPPPPPAVSRDLPHAEGVVLVKTREVSAREAGVLGRASGMRLRVDRRWDSLDLLKVRILSGETVPEAVERLARVPGVEYAEPDYRVQAQEVLPTDPRFPELWGLKNTGASGGLAGADVEATLAWDTTQGSRQVIVAVIDTGIEYTHPDLAANMWANPGEVAGNSVDDDGNGVVDDVHGINGITGSGDPMDDNNHGTHVAGTIAAVGNNGIGVVGVAPNVRLMACKFLDSGGYGSISDAVTCLDYATRMGARVANSSWGGGGESQAFADALARARTAGMIMACAAGNNGSDNDASPNFPSNVGLDNVIAVGSSTRTETVSDFSNYGLTTVDLFAPGSEILSTVRGSAYSSMSGTSMASPHVAGICALVLSMDLSQTVLSVRSRVLAGVEASPAYAGKCATGGRANARLALAAPVPALTLASLSPAALRPGATLTLEGQGFGTSQGAGSVTLGDAPVPAISSWSDGRIVLQVPEIATGSWAVQVRNAGGEASNILQLLVDSGVSYEESSAPYDFRDISATGTALTLGDDSWHIVNLGFTFPFYGESQTQVTVASNGYLTFGGSGSAYQNEPIPSMAQPNRLIAPLWMDLNPSKRGSIHVQTRGAAPNREFVAQWTAVPHFPDLGDATFQAVLREATGDILFLYQDTRFDTVGYDDGFSATIGVESLAGTAGTPHTGPVTAGTCLRFAAAGSSTSPEPSPSPGLGESMPLSAGWNCLSFPVMRLTEVQAVSGVSLAFAYDGETQSYQIVPVTAAGFNAGAGLRRGFWVFATAATTLGYSGVDNDGSVQTVDLPVGWNLVGVPNRNALAGADILVRDRETQATLPFPQAVSAQVPAPAPYLLHRWLSSWRTGEYSLLDGTTTALSPKSAYWIYAWKPAQLEFQASTTGRPLDRP